jgi:FkbM family methyltransferase
MDGLANNLVRRLSKPQYAFRPGQVVRRVSGASPGELPWKLPFSYEPTGVLGGSLARAGVHDLVVSETLWRLIDPGDSVLDAGANIGYMTSIMAKRVGRHGHIDAFEPHPETFRQLSHNVGRWDAPVTLHNLALAAGAGTVDLFGVADGDGNQIRASISQRYDSGDYVTVEATTMDEAVSQSVKLIKIDIEGSELPALRGATRVLEGVEHIVYEDHDPQPSELTHFLEQAGFTSLLLEERFFGPKARRDLSRPRGLGWDAPSFLATRSVGDAAARLAPRGWRCLSSKAAR